MVAGGELGGLNGGLRGLRVAVAHSIRHSLASFGRDPYRFVPVLPSDKSPYHVSVVGGWGMCGLVQVVSKDTGDDGWWMGKLADKKGVFPHNYCKVQKDPLLQSAVL